MPKLWTDTIAGHRQQVDAAVLDAAQALTLERGVFDLTMSDIAEHAGVGRATLYKYYKDIPSILAAWHSREAQAHGEALQQHISRVQPGLGRVKSALRFHAYALRDAHAGPLLAMHLAGTNEESIETIATVTNTIRHQLAELIEHDCERPHEDADELAVYATAALGAAPHLPNRRAVDRLIDRVLASIERS